VIDLQTLESYVSRVARTSVTISCDAPSTFATSTSTVVVDGVPGTVTSKVLGYTVSVDGAFLGVIHLPKPTCTRLQHADDGNLIDPADMLVLTHESLHIGLASTDECVVEAAAMKNEWSLLKLFRLAAWRARAILAGAAAVDAQMPAAYHDCST
jgi:hypothetical protein